MEQLPSGANFKRAKTLWEIGLHIAGNPATPYFGPRDMRITIGSGSGEHYRPWLSMATGSPALAHAVASGELDLAFVNPSGLLTQAYRGTGLFSTALPVRVVASYPTWDRFVYAVHPRTGLTSLRQIKERRYPLRLSIREDTTHSTRVLVDQTLAALGISLDDLKSWGGSLQLNGPPGDARRLAAMEAGEVDAVFDEGIILWLPQALEQGYQLLTLDEAAFGELTALGWRRVFVPRDFSSVMDADYECLDYSGWPLYTRESLPAEDAYKVCAAIAARQDEVPWEDTFEAVAKLGLDAEATPVDVPLHPGAVQWYREQGIAL